MVHVQRTVDDVNWLNIGLMIAACVAALVAPFHVFLLAYAVLGPLHYLTEVSWLHDREYFTPRRRARRAWLALVALSVSALAYGYVSETFLQHQVSPTFEIGTVYLVIAGAVLAARVQHPVNAVALLVLVTVALVLFSRSPVYAVAAYLLVTIVHVLLFTAVFVLVGAVKTRNRIGVLSLLVFAGCIFTTLVYPRSFAPATPPVRDLYATFEQLNIQLLSLFGGQSAGAYEPSSIGVMRLIAFAYLYHYLNWFSKTSIIRWHEVSRGRVWAVILLWLGGLAVYVVDYRAGFALFYVLSLAHVLLEFPLNHRTFAELARLTRRDNWRRPTVAG
ncbi:MAG: hypothetical protein ACHQJD_05200 [Thermoanaerobaculia bacterium]